MSSALNVSPPARVDSLPFFANVFVVRLVLLRFFSFFSTFSLQEDVEPYFKAYRTFTKMLNDSPIQV